jgi:hypothetical protein
MYIKSEELNTTGFDVHNKEMITNNRYQESVTMN